MNAIYDDFAVKLNAFAAGLSPAIPVGFPGVGFAPPDSGLWLEAQWMPNETVNYGLADDAPSLLQGMAQVGVCCRPGAGIMEPLGIADMVIVAFAKGTKFANSVRVYRKPWVSGAIEDPERVMHPVTIMWRGLNA